MVDNGAVGRGVGRASRLQTYASHKCQIEIGLGSFGGHWLP